MDHTPVLLWPPPAANPLPSPTPKLCASTQGIVDVLRRHAPLRDRLPVTIHRRLDAAGTLLATLAGEPDALGPGEVVTGQTALRGVVGDVLKALRLPSLLRAGASHQFCAWAGSVEGEVESAAVYADVLVADASEAAESAVVRARGALC